MKNQQLVVVSSNAPFDAEVVINVGGQKHTVQKAELNEAGELELTAISPPAAESTGTASAGSAENAAIVAEVTTPAAPAPAAGETVVE